MYRVAIYIALLVTVAAGSVWAAEEETPRAKSPETATTWSLMGTLVPVGFGVSTIASGSESPLVVVGALAFFGGSIVGPGLGHDYAGAKGRFWSGVGLRTAGWVGTFVVIGLTWDSGNEPGLDIGEVAGYGSLALIAGSTLYDIATAARSAENYNQKHGLQSLSLKPTFDPSSGTTGLQLTIQL